MCLQCSCGPLCEPNATSTLAVSKISARRVMGVKYVYCCAHCPNRSARFNEMSQANSSV